MTIDELFIALGLKTDGVKKGAKEAENAISGMTSSIVAKLGVLSAGAAAALSIFSRFGEYVAQADAMGKLADALDVDIEKMHAWGEAAARAGGSVEGFQGSLQSLTTQLARQATVGTSRAAKMLEGVGIDAGEIGRQRQAFDVMMDLAEKAETMGKQEFFGLGRSLGLDQGTIMLLQQGRAALKEQIRLQKEFGVYTKEDAKLTANWNDRVADFGQVMKSFSAIIFRMVLPAMTKFVEYVNKAVAFLRKHEKFVQAFFIGLATVITAILIPALVKLAAAFFANPITWFVVGLTALALAIEDLVVWAEGGESALSDLWKEIFGSPEEAMETWENLKKAVGEFGEEIKNYLPDIQSFGDVLVSVIKLSFEPLLFLINLFRTIKDILQELSPTVREAIAPLAPAFKSAFETIQRAWEDLRNSFSSGIDVIKSAFSSLCDMISSRFSEALSTLKTAWDNTIGKLELPSLPSFGGGGEKAEKHADGGIFNTPHMGVVAESGAEAIIPLSEGKKNRAFDLLSKIAGNFMPNTETTPKFEMPSISLPKFEMPSIQAAQSLPMGGATTNNNINSDTRVTVGTVNISAADGTDAANQFMTGVETRAAMWTAAANVAY